MHPASQSPTLRSGRLQLRQVIDSLHNTPARAGHRCALLRLGFSQHSFGAHAATPLGFGCFQPRVDPHASAPAYSLQQGAAKAGAGQKHTVSCRSLTGLHPSHSSPSLGTHSGRFVHHKTRGLGAWVKQAPAFKQGEVSAAPAEENATSDSMNYGPGDFGDSWDVASSNGTGPTGVPPVALITTAGCPYCKKAKSALRQAGIDYEEIDLSGNLQLLEKVKETTGRTTVPQVFLGGLLIGGADETLAAIDDGSFQAALEGDVGPALPDYLREEVDRAMQSSPQAYSAVPQPLLPEGMDEERYQALHALANRIHGGLVPGGNYMFTVAEGVEWLRRAKAASSPEAALATLADLQRAHLLYATDGSGADLSVVDAGLSVDPRTGAASAPAATNTTPLQLVQDAPLPRLGDTLNGRVPWYGDARPASQVSEGLRRLILGLYDAHLAVDGRGVNYNALVQDPAFSDYVTATSELQKVNLYQMSREERMAFFINIYNALVVHGMAVFGPAENTLKRLYWFSAVKYNIGGHAFSANDIEHGVLRANAPSPASIGVLLGKPSWSHGQFKKHDPRLKLICEPLDPRIHFALVCGAKSCPPIRVYTPASLEPGLEAAAQAFCSGEVELDHAAREVTMSMIFKWYKADFGPPEVMLPWLLQYLPDDVAHELEDMLAHDGGAATIKISYRPYDWSVNTIDDDQ